MVQIGQSSSLLGGYDTAVPLIIYGAGSAGRSVARHLAGRGVAVGAFLDSRAVEGDVHEGVPALTLSNWLADHDASRHEVLICLHNPHAEVAPVIDTLSNAGFKRVLTMIDYINGTNDTQFRYWLAPTSFYRDKQPRIDAARQLLTDEASTNLMDASLRLRLQGDYHGLPEPSFVDQYVPADLPRWADPMRLVDCGAYDGDSIETMLAAGYQLDALVAFEPDLVNYVALAQRFPGLNGTYLPCGVSDETQLVTFNAGLGPSSRVESGGSNHIQCVSIDLAIGSFAPTLIKMDVEGSEPAALRGAQETLRRHRPGLAISVYHEPDHLWEIPLFIDSLNLGYSMALRPHGHSGYDTVLYCWVG